MENQQYAFESIQDGEDFKKTVIDMIETYGGYGSLCSSEDEIEYIVGLKFEKFIKINSKLGVSFSPVFYSFEINEDSELLKEALSLHDFLNRCGERISDLRTAALEPIISRSKNWSNK
ncbi:MAG: hypothetical protein LBI26_03535 [Holosporales bacterium]|jgi:hypothetical protein|nr:hypothetical protein [Holosporales bacterium]